MKEVKKDFIRSLFVMTCLPESWQHSLVNCDVSAPKRALVFVCILKLTLSESIGANPKQSRKTE